MEVYAQAIERGFHRYFKKYGKQQLHLWMLVTHPEYRRQGAGTMLCRWGEEQAARKEHLHVTVMASPMGRTLYTHLGYEVIGQERAVVEGEDEWVDIDLMEIPKEKLLG